MQSQASQLDKCKSMHVGQSKRVIDRAFMWRGALDAFGNHRFKDPAPAPSSSASRAAAKSAHVRKFTCSHQVQYGWPPARGCWSACPPALQATYGLISLNLCCRRVIMFLCASRLPSFAPGHRPSHGPRNQVTAGIEAARLGMGVGAWGSVLNQSSLARSGV